MSSSSSSEKKPFVLSSHVTVKVKSQDEKCVIFRVRKDVGLGKLMEAYSHKVGVELSTFAFLLDGVILCTPNQLELEDGVEIDAFLQGDEGFNLYCGH